MSTGNRSRREWVHISGKGVNVKSGEGRRDGREVGPLAGEKLKELPSKGFYLYCEVGSKDVQGEKVMFLGYKRERVTRKQRRLEMTGKICCEKKSKQTAETKEQSLATLRARLSSRSINLQGHDAPLLRGFALATFKNSHFRAQVPTNFF